MRTCFPKSQKTGEKICFKTVDQAVFDADGRPLSDRLLELASQISANQVSATAISDATNLALDNYQTSNNIRIDAAESDIDELQTKVLGLTGAMHFAGIVEAVPANGTIEYESGDVVVIKSTHKEYVYDGSEWNELGDEGSHITKTEVSATYETKVDAETKKAALMADIVTCNNRVSNTEGIITAQLNLLHGRLENLIPDNVQTAGNTELLDIRTGHDGTNYSTAGTAVREQIKAIYNADKFRLASLLPSFSGGLPEISTVDNTFTIHYDTLLISKRFADGWKSLRSSTEYHAGLTVSFAHITSSAVCIYYDIDNNVLVALPYNDTSVNNYNYLLVATIRDRSANAIEDNTITVCCSCDVLIDKAYINSTESRYTIMYDNTNIKSINHRGFNAIAPENTLSAYRLSKQRGFKYVEADVTFTSDNIPVLLHDDTIDRTSNGTGHIKDLTFEQVRSYDFGTWKEGSGFDGEKIPSFEEFILLCKKLGLHPYIEIKDTHTHTQANVESLVTLVKRYGMKDNVTWISFNHNYLTYVKNFDNTARIGYLVDGNNVVSAITTATSLSTDSNEVFINAQYSTLTDEMVEACIAANLSLEVWTADTEDGINNLDPYVTGVTSNSLVAGHVAIKDGLFNK